MQMNKKGNVVVAALILSSALCVCTVFMVIAMKKAKDSMIYYAEVQKEDALNRLRDQKNELRFFVRAREARMRNFVRDELKKFSSIEVKRTAE